MKPTFNIFSWFCLLHLVMTPVNKIPTLGVPKFQWPTFPRSPQGHSTQIMRTLTSLAEIISGEKITIVSIKLHLVAKCITLYSSMYSSEEEWMNKSSYCKTPIVKIGYGQFIWTYRCVMYANRTIYQKRSKWAMLSVLTFILLST